MVNRNERIEVSDVDDLVGDAPLRARDSVDRRSRELESPRDADDRGLNDDEDEKFALFAQQHFNGVLPDIPPIPGYHVCWLSTNHQADTIPKRIRMGYTPVKPDEVEGFEHVTLKTGEYAGLIGVNEMVAFKIPQSLYLRYMQYNHHDEPARQVEGINAQVDSLKGQAERDGGRIIEGDGMEEIRRSAPSRGRFE